MFKTPIAMLRKQHDFVPLGREEFCREPVGNAIAAGAKQLTRNKQPTQPKLATYFYTMHPTNAKTN
jgi:hypothetical protein